MAPAGKKEDPIEKIRALIKEELGTANEERDRKDREAKDPWERLRGIVRDEVGAHFEAFGKGAADADKGKPDRTDKADKNDDPLSLFG
jgi:hypothetical protein